SSWPGGRCPCSSSGTWTASEGLLGRVVGGRRGLVGHGAAAAAAAPAPVAAVAAFVLRDLGRGPAQARPDLVGDDLDDRASLAVGRLPRALLEAAAHDDAGALLERLADVLRQVAPAGDVEEGGALLPLLALPVLPPAVHGHAEGGDRGTRGREAQLGIAGEVPDDRDVGGHGASYLAACSSRPRRAASSSGRRTSLWRTVSSASRSARSSWSSSLPPTNSKTT